MADCLFCDMASGKMQVDKLYELEKGPFALDDHYLGVRLVT